MTTDLLDVPQSTDELRVKNQEGLNRLAQAGVAPPFEILLKERLDVVTEFLIGCVAHLADVGRGEIEDELAVAWEHHMDQFVTSALTLLNRATLLEGVPGVRP